MIKGLPGLIRTLAILLALFAGQAAALVHSADHPFHEPTEACDAFIALESAGAASQTGHAGALLRVQCLVHTCRPFFKVSAGAASAYSSRAPPFFSC